MSPYVMPPVEQFQEPLSSMPADDTRWLGRLVWTAVWLVGGLCYAGLAWWVWG